MRNANVFSAAGGAAMPMSLGTHAIVWYFLFHASRSVSEATRYPSDFASSVLVVKPTGLVCRILLLSASVGQKARLNAWQDLQGSLELVHDFSQQGLRRQIHWLRWNNQTASDLDFPTWSSCCPTAQRDYRSRAVTF